MRAGQVDDAVQRVRWRVILAALIGVVWPMYPGLARPAIHPDAVRHDGQAWSAAVELSRAQGFVPPFRAAERSRLAPGVRVHWRPDTHVELRAAWAWWADTMPASGTVSGPGDLRLGTLVDHAAGPLELGGSWEVKLPNARDEGELGSDETDVSIVGTVGRRWAPVSVRASGGLSIRGDPIRFANQDDVPQVWLSAVGHGGRLHLSSRVGGDLATTRSPARLQATLGAVRAAKLSLGAEASAGLTPAAADWGGRLWAEWGSGPPRD